MARPKNSRLVVVVGWPRLLAGLRTGCSSFFRTSGALEFGFSDGGVGLSGVGYGLFGLLWILSKRDHRFADAVDARTIQTFIIWFFVCIATTIMHVMQVANIAHGGGAALGILTGY